MSSKKRKEEEEEGRRKSLYKEKFGGINEKIKNAEQIEFVLGTHSYTHTSKKRGKTFKVSTLGSNLVWNNTDVSPRREDIVNLYIVYKHGLGQDIGYIEPPIGRERKREYITRTAHKFVNYPKREEKLVWED